MKDNTFKDENNKPRRLVKIHCEDFKLYCEYFKNGITYNCNF